MKGKTFWEQFGGLSCLISCSFFRRRVLYQVLLILFGISLIAVYFTFRYDAVLNYFDSYDYVQIARNLYQGDGYTTKLITPLSWSNIPKIPHPDFWRPPLYPLLMAAGFVCFGVDQIVGLAISVIAFLMTILLTYHVGKQVAGPRAGFVAGIFVVTCPPLFRMGVYVLTESLFTMLMVSSLLVLTWDEDHPLILGILAGLTYLTRFNAVFFIVGVLLLASLRTDEKISFFRDYTLAILCILTPWILRNLVVSGSLLYNHQTYQVLSGTAQHEGWGIFFYFNLQDPLEYVLSNPINVILKWSWSAPTSYDLIFHALRKYWITVILAVSVFPLVLTKRRQSNLRKGLVLDFWVLFVLVILLQIITLGFLIINYRYFLPYLVFVSLFAGISLDSIINLNPKVGYLSLILALLFNCYSLFTLSFPKYLLPVNEFKALKKYIPKNELVLSNQYFFLPYYADRHTLAPPRRFESAERHYPQFEYVYLRKIDGVQASKIHQVLVRNWTRNETFRSNFKLLKVFPSGGKLYKRKVVY